MIDKRIDYVNMINNSMIKGGKHSSSTGEEKNRCTELFLNNEDFRERVRTTIPAVVSLERLYHVGVEVNRFQQEELNQCDNK